MKAMPPSFFRTVRQFEGVSALSDPRFSRIAARRAHVGLCRGLTRIGRSCGRVSLPAMAAANVADSGVRRLYSGRLLELVNEISVFVPSTRISPRSRFVLGTITYTRQRNFVPSLTCQRSIRPEYEIRHLIYQKLILYSGRLLG